MTERVLTPKPGVARGKMRHVALATIDYMIL